MLMALKKMALRKWNEGALKSRSCLSLNEVFHLDKIIVASSSALAPQFHF